MTSEPAVMSPSADTAATPAPRSHFNLVPADVFCTSLFINAHSAGLSDADFRAFVINSLKCVAFQEPCPSMAVGLKDQSGGAL